MHRQPKAVGRRAVRRPLAVLATAAVTLCLLVPSGALGREPAPLGYPPSIGPDGRNADLPRPGVPWSPEAVELAHTARQAVKRGTTEQSCTGWRSHTEPPPTIRVLRTARGVVETVPFKDYVLTVMSSEWAHYWPFQTVQVGAVAVKQYGWYYTIVYRGGRTASGACYDVRDSTIDQLYRPGYREIFPAHRKAVRQTWDISLRKWKAAKGRSEFILTGYRSGTSGVKCGEDSNGRLLFQRSIFSCGNRGHTMEQIFRFYLTKRVEVIDPGVHDITGAGYGDASVLVRSSDDARTPHVFEATGPTLAGPALPAWSLAADTYVAARSTDVDRNGWDDLVTLERTTSGYRLTVAKSNGAYGSPTEWATVDEQLGTGATLLAGDFDGDLLGDAAILRPGAEPGTARLVMFRAEKRRFAGPEPWWSGELDLDETGIFAGDANGDGRADLIVATPTPEGLIEYQVAASLSRGGGLAPLAVWHRSSELAWDDTRHVVSDVDRDGRDDLYVLSRRANGSTRFSALQAGKSLQVFAPVARPAGDAEAIAYDSIKVGTADTGCQARYRGDCPNGDAFGDLVLYVNGVVENGTRIVPLMGRYDDLEAGRPLDVTDLAWERIQPY